MIDINFYRKTYNIVKSLSNKDNQPHEVLFEKYRSKEPVVYNIETTNACNMKCEMCPRTTKMTRPIETLKPEVFRDIIYQIRPWTLIEWSNWRLFVEDNYNIGESDPPSENHFFLYVIPKVIQLHGYGDPLLDVCMVQYITLLRDREFQSYFSCNPANINMSKTEEMFDSGLNYIKYSIESVDDDKHKQIRGNASNFTESYKKICQLLELKAKRNYKTTIVITMLDLNKDKQQDEYQKLKDAFKDKDVYLYLKSEDQQWYRKDYHGTKSIHWSEVCRHPWMSMTIKSNAEVAMCMEDYNNEITLGNAKTDSLFDIWNGNKYRQFRENHIKNCLDNKCGKECDMPTIGEFLI